jgi:hypothetical protein
MAKFSHEVSLFCVQSTISITVMVFCIYQLIDRRDPGVYLPVLTGILGYWLPSPSSRKPTTNQINTETANLLQPDINKNISTNNNVDMVDMLEGFRKTAHELNNFKINIDNTQPLNEETTIKKQDENISAESGLTIV